VTFTQEPVDLAAEEAAVVCNANMCTYNDRANCMADGVAFGAHSTHAECLTFRPR
jgi:hypothetical protein